MRKNKKKDNIFGYMLISPWLIGFVVMFLIPMCMSIYYSFTDYNLLTEPNFIGLDNYIRMFTKDRDFINSLKVTFIYVFALVPLRLAFALMIALLINQKRRGVGIYRTIYYVPSIVGGNVALAIVWRQLFGNNGVVMSLLGLFGIQQEISFIGNPKTALGTIVLLGVWQFGSPMLIFLAALKQVPASIYESASLDGASGVTKFLKITLPMISPTIFFNLILQIIGAFRAFNECYIITGGGPMKSTMFYVLNLYDRAFKYFEMGYSSAMAWVLVAIIACFAGVIFKTQNNWVYYESKGGA